MYSFTAESWADPDEPYALSGPVATMPASQIPPGMWDPVDLIGQVVEVDGKVYLVAGVETFSVPRSPEQPYRRPFGLLVHEAA